MKLYRIGSYFYRRNIPFLLRFFDGLIRITHNCAVYSQTEIGLGTQFSYGGIGVVIHKRAVIGRNCVIGTNVTVGGRSNQKNVPVIGDNVYIATGAKVLGSVTIGDDCIVGANAVVLNDAPAGSVIVGIPGVVKCAR